MNHRTGWALLIAATALFCCMLSFYGRSDAAPQAAQLPFANAVEQRMETINQLKEVCSLLKEQNALIKEQGALLNQQNAVLNEQIALLRSGKLEVVATQAGKH